MKCMLPKKHFAPFAVFFLFRKTIRLSIIFEYALTLSIMELVSDFDSDMTR